MDNQEIEFYEKEIHVFQRSENLLLTHLDDYYFDFIYAEKAFYVQISQDCFRKIRIGSMDHVDDVELYDVFRFLESFIYILDGEYLSTYDIVFWDKQCSNVRINEEVCKKENDKPSLFHSAHFWYELPTLCDYSEVKIGELLPKWSRLVKQLGIVHPTIEYCLSKSNFPIDVKVALMIESSESMYQLCGYTEKRSLQKQIEHLLINRGKEIFETEISGPSLQKQTKKMKNTRVNIMHVKMEREEQLSKDELPLYIAKFSLLYRKILMEKMEILSDAVKTRLSILSEQAEERFAVKISE